MEIGSKTQIYLDGELLGEVDNLIVTYGINETLEIKMPNTRNRINLSNLRDLIADGHNEIMCAASDANLSMIKFDEHLDKTNNAPVLMAGRVGSRLFKFQEELIAQARRLERVREEVEEIRKNIKVS